MCTFRSVKILVAILLTSLASLNSYAQEVYYKYYDIQKVNDSIIAEIDKISERRITYLKNCYWWNGSDTTIEPNIKNSFFNFYRDTTGNDYAIVTTKYFTVGPLETYCQALGYLEYNLTDVLYSRIRPDNSDKYIDTNEVNRLLTENPVMPRKFAEELSTVSENGFAADGIKNYIEISTRDSLYKFSFGEEKFEPEFKYYNSNSKSSIYTFKLLLDLDRNYMLDAINWGKLQNDEASLSGLKRIQWLLHQIDNANKRNNQYMLRLKKEKFELENNK